MASRTSFDDALTCLLPQRFGGRLSLYVHFHHLAADAVFDKHGDGLRIHEAPPPAQADVMEVARRVHDRALAWLRRHRYVDELHADDRSNKPPEDTPIDAFARLALAGGTFLGRTSYPTSPPAILAAIDAMQDLRRWSAGRTSSWRSRRTRSRTRSPRVETGGPPDMADRVHTGPLVTGPGQKGARA